MSSDPKTVNVTDPERENAMYQQLGAGQFISGTTHATPDTEVAFAHSLGRVPRGFLLVSVNKGDIIYAGSTANTSSAIYLRSGTTAVTFTAYVF